MGAPRDPRCDVPRWAANEAGCNVIHSRRRVRQLLFWRKAVPRNWPRRFTSDWMLRFNTYIEDGKTERWCRTSTMARGPATSACSCVCTASKKAFVAGMRAGMCVEAHAHEHFEQCFELIIAQRSSQPASSAKSVRSILSSVSCTLSTALRIGNMLPSEDLAHAPQAQNFAEDRLLLQLHCRHRGRVSMLDEPRRVVFRMRHQDASFHHVGAWSLDQRHKNFV